MEAIIKNIPLHFLKVQNLIKDAYLSSTPGSTNAHDHGSVTLAPDVLDYLEGRSVPSKLDLFNHYLDSLRTAGVEAESLERLPPIYQDVSMAQLANLYLIGNDRDDYSGEMLGRLLGPIGWRMFLKQDGDLPAKELLLNLFKNIHLMERAGVSFEQRLYFKSSALSQFFKSNMATLPAFFKLELPEQHYSPFDIDDKGLLLELAEKIVSEGLGSSLFRQQLGLALACIPGDHGPLIKDLLSLDQFPTPSLLSAFPLELELAQVERAETFERNQGIFRQLLTTASPQQRDLIATWEAENIVRFGDESAVSSLEMDRLDALIDDSLELIPFIWGRRSVRRAWIKLLNTLHNSGQGQLIYKLILNPYVLRNESDCSWCIDPNTISIIHRLICAPRFANTAFGQDFVGLWYRAMSQLAKDTKLASLLSLSEFMECLMKAYQIAEETQDETMQKKLYKIFRENQKVLDAHFMRLDLQYMHASFLMRLFAKTNAFNVTNPRIPQLVLFYCFGLKPNYKALLEAFIDANPQGMAQKFDAIRNNAVLPNLALRRLQALDE